eukprot:jgi/Ulvmu1/6335/UM029_0043.1
MLRADGMRMRAGRGDTGSMSLPLHVLKGSVFCHHTVNANAAPEQKTANDGNVKSTSGYVRLYNLLLCHYKKYLQQCYSSPCHASWVPHTVSSSFQSVEVQGGEMGG